MSLRLMTAISPYARLSKNVVGVMPLLSVDQTARRNAGVARYPIEDGSELINTLIKAS